jgi:hypothetical protein
MQRRLFLGLLGSMTASAAIALPRIEPKFEVRPPLLRCEKGVPLTIEEMDQNFRDLHARVSRLENMS